MKKLIIPLVVALIAGLGGGSAFTYVRASKLAKAQQAAQADSIAKAAKLAAAHPAAHDSVTPPDSLADDTTDVVDSLMTPADSIRAQMAKRTSLKSATHGLPDAQPVKAESIIAAHAGTKPAIAAAKGATAGANHSAAEHRDSTPAVSAVKPGATPNAANTRAVAEAVKSARNDALSTALPEERIAKIFSQMQARDAARVLEQMDDKDIRAVLALMGDRQAAAILAAFTPTRAAAISKGALKVPGDKE